MNRAPLPILSAVAAFSISALATPAATPAAPQLWYWHHSYLVTDEAVKSSEALIDRAAAADYTGVALWDSSFSFLSDPFWPAENVNRLRRVLDYAAHKGLKVIVPVAPFGFANDVLQANPNLAEAQRVLGSQFQVDASGKRVRLINSFRGLEDPGFEAGDAPWASTGWFGTHDADISIDSSVAHTGRASAVIRNARGNARYRQQIALTPWRQYHLRLFFKSQGFRGLAQVGVLDRSNGELQRLSAPISANGSHDWTQVDFTFNSQTSTAAWLYLGVWGGSAGTLWLDDILIEETALVYVVRRPGAPVKVYDAANPSTIYRERSDFNPIADPRITATRTPFTDLYHAPAPITLPPGTRLHPGQRIAIDFYAVFPIPGLDQVAMCFTEQGVLDWQRRNAQAIRAILPPQAAILLQYDEIRQMNSCASCRARHLEAAGLLDWSVHQSAALYHSLFPSAPLLVWNDMFDPLHNARPNYYYVEGDLTGAWKNLPPDLAVLNWNLDHLRDSLRWFSGQDSRQPSAHRQIIAGYYDKGDGAAAARSELTQAAGIPGIDGLMYTTWSDDYSQLEPFAAAAKANWLAYATTLSKPGHDPR